jgi:lipopolysaccharide transport system ATP-binding protein
MAVSDPIITVDQLSKRYVIGHQRGKGDGLRHAIEQAARHPVAWLKDRSRKVKGKKEEFWALKNVTFQINRGEVVGILGRNGAGKSTLLKILSRITEPTTGRIHLKGRVASLLEVGTGFHQELTGRENIYLNGAILGMKRAEIRRKFDEIVAFSEVEKFLDTPVKRYSSGMYVRLAFAVAAHLEPEILIVDEVLAVGDAAFQNKCLGKMREVARGGRTVMFVSHNMESVRRLCSRGILIHDGTVRMDNDIDQVLDAYSSSLAQPATTVLHNRNLGLTVFDIRLRNQDDQICSVFRPGDDLMVELNYEVNGSIDLPQFIIAIQSFNGTCFTANMLLDGRRPAVLQGRGRVACIFKSIPLLPQSYTVQLAIFAKNGKDRIINFQDVSNFTVSCNLTDYDYKGEFLALAAHSTPMVVPYQWQLPDGTIASVALNLPREQSLKS